MPWTENVRLIDDNGKRPKKSKSGPALSGDSVSLVMVHLGDSSDGIWSSHLLPDGSGWTDDEQIGAEQAGATPAIAGELLFYPDARTGRFVRAGLVASFPPAELKDAEGRALELHVQAAVALSNDIYHLVFRAVRGDMSYLLWRRGFLESYDGPGNEEQGLFETHARPAMVILGDTIHLVYLGVDSNDIWHAKGRISFDRDEKLTVHWVQKQVGGQLSQASPALAVFNGRVHMVHIGDSSSRLWHAVYIPELDSWTQDRIPAQRSKTTPGIAAFNGRLHMVYLDQDSNLLWWSRWRDDE